MSTDIRFFLTVSLGLILILFAFMAGLKMFNHVIEESICVNGVLHQRYITENFTRPSQIKCEMIKEVSSD